MSNVIGERLRILREEKKLSQADFAELMDVNRMTINNYENGKRTPDVLFAAAAASQFNVTLEYLTGLSEFRNKEDFTAAIDKANHLHMMVAQMPQVEGQQVMSQLVDLLENSNRSDTSVPILLGMIRVINEFSSLLKHYEELEENIIHTTAELRWQKVQSPLIQWTCVEKTKAINENALDAANSVFSAFQLCAKMLNRKLMKTLEAESEK